MPHVRTGRTVLLAAFVLTLLVVLLTTASVGAAPPGRSPDTAGGGTSYLVGLLPGTSRAEAYTLARRAGLVPERWIPELAVLVVRPASGGPSIASAADVLLHRPEVLRLEPNYVVSGAEVPNDPEYDTTQWAPQKVGAEAAWSITHGSPAVTVAVLDTGLDMGHPEMVGKYTAGYDFVNDDSDPADDHGHGTHVAGIIGALTNNATGVASVGWDTTIMPVKVLNGSNLGNHATIASGIVWATDQGADVINLSLGGSASSQTLEDAVNYAYSHGALVVAAAGNGGTSAPYYPAAYANAMGIGATTVSDTRWFLSNYGSWLSMTAPGDQIRSTDWTGGAGPYTTRSGTSQAAPHVSAVAALMLAVNPALSNDQLRNLLESTAVDLGASGFDSYYGYGRLDAAAAVQAAGGSAPPTPTTAPPTATPTSPPPTPTTAPPTATPTSPPPTPTTAPPSQYLQRVNAGGGDYMAKDGSSYSADRSYVAGSWGYTGGGARYSSRSVAGTTDDPLYQAYRENPGEYRFDVPNGDYEVTLHFAEFSVRKARDRQMRITIEGVVVEDRLSIYAEVGRYTALDRTYMVTVEDGQLNVVFSKNGGKKKPVVSALDIIQLGSASPSGGSSPINTPLPTPTSPPPTSTSPLPTPTSLPPTATPQPQPSDSMHVGDLDGSTSRSGRDWRAMVTVAVYDSGDQPVAGATVSGSWSRGYKGSASCVTDDTGRCSVWTGRLKKKVSSVTFTVEDVSHDSLVYVADGNQDPDGDSNGTRIVVRRP